MPFGRDPLPGRVGGRTDLAIPLVAGPFRVQMMGGIRARINVSIFVRTLEKGESVEDVPLPWKDTMDSIRDSRARGCDESADPWGRWTEKRVLARSLLGTGGVDARERFVDSCCTVSRRDVRDVYHDAMIRKQLYITEAQNEALKRRAQALGISEAELVRRALDASLTDAASKSSARRAELDELLERTRDLASRHRLPSGYRFDRDELYAERTRPRDDTQSASER